MSRSLANKLSITQNWNSIYHTNNLSFSSKTQINKFVEGILYAYDFLTSNIIIKILPGNHISIYTFIYYNGAENSPTLSNIYIKKIIKTLIKKKYKFNSISFNYVQIPSFALNDTIFCKWLEFNISKFPSKQEFYLRKAMEEYKKILIR